MNFFAAEQLSEGSAFFPSPLLEREIASGLVKPARRIELQPLEKNIDLFGEKSWTLADLARRKDGRLRTRLLRGGDAARVWEDENAKERLERGPKTSIFEAWID